MTSLTPSPDFRRTRLQQLCRYTFFGFAAVAAFFLITEHGAHLLGWLPFLIILACPLMHIFGHGGHGGHDHGGGSSAPEDRGAAQREGTLPNPDPGNPPANTPAHHHH